MGLKRKVKPNVHADDITLFEAFNDFLEEKRARNISEATIKNYRQSFQYYCEYNGYTDTTTTKDVKEASIYKFINVMKNRQAKPTSINHYLRDVRTFLNWCMHENRNYISPSFEIKEVQKQDEGMKMFTDDELELLLEKPKRNSKDFVEWRTWAIVNWILGTGNRAATICELKVGDINFAQREITLKHTKNKKVQIIPLSPSTETCIKEYIRRWRSSASLNSWLFPNVGDNQLTTNALHLSFSRYCKERGVSKSNIHGLRHNFAAIWVRNNGNVFALQHILGHQTLDMTRKYVHMYSQDLKEGYEVVVPLDTIKGSRKRTKLVRGYNE